MKRGALLIIAGVVLMVVVFAIYALVNRQPQTAVDKSLTIYMPFDEVKIYEKISANFTVANPNIDLVFKYIEAQDAKEYEAIVINEIANGEGPDIWLVRSDWIPKHAAKSLAFEPTSDQPDPIEAVKALIEPAIVDLNTYKGKLYGVPLFADSLAIIYNLTLYREVASNSEGEDKEILSQFPATWDILKKQTAIVTKNKGSVITRSAIALGTVETTYAPVDVLSAMLLQSGASLLTEDESGVAFNLAQFKDGKTSFPATSALGLFTSFSKSTEPNYSWNNDLGDAVEAFKAQKTGAIIGYYSLFVSLNKAKVGFKLGIAPLPQLTENADRIDFGITWSHIINIQTKKINGARSFLQYLSTDEVQGEYSVETKKISARLVSIAVPEQIHENVDNAFTVFKAQFKFIKQVNKPEWQKVDELLQDAIKLVANSNQSIQSAVDSTAIRLKELLK